MKRGYKWRLVCVALLGATLGCLHLSATPRFGDKLPLKPEMPKSVQIKFFIEEKSTSESKLGADAVAALHDARGGGPPCLCPPLGNIVLENTNGETAKLYLQPGHWIGRTDIIFEGRRYSMSTGKFSKIFNKSWMQTNSR
jgi:hypothetical protein